MRFTARKRSGEENRTTDKKALVCDGEVILHIQIYSM